MDVPRKWRVDVGGGRQNWGVLDGGAEEARTGREAPRRGATDEGRAAERAAIERDLHDWTELSPPRCNVRVWTVCAKGNGSRGRLLLVLEFETTAVL